ncbi:MULTISPECIES: conjugal transfer protein TrbL family protein [Bacillus]|uniref:conjugal transfer protein TrbL family protein n=1 Tax=Bacillus TaxID=1386 RepID=UPI000BF746BA|nr:MULTISPECIES: conjugal transfer protein TrbL family protein [Bacillus]PFW05326.1 conjugal transfer protein TraL [Bacillus thuringiensis]QEQ20794.1 conjugal transfer protein TraL [Bacillus sp. BS98]
MWDKIKGFFTTVTNPIEAFMSWIVESCVQLISYILGNIIQATKIDENFQQVEVISNTFNWVRFGVYGLIGSIFIYALFKQYLAVSTGAVEYRSPQAIIGDTFRFVFRILLLPLFIDIMIKINGVWVDFITKKGLVVDKFLKLIGLDKASADSKSVLEKIGNVYKVEATVIVSVFVVLMLAIVFIALFFQLVVRMGQIVMGYILIPVVAMSALNQNLDLYDSWWREMLAIIFTQALQVTGLYLGLNVLLSGHFIFGTGILVSTITAPSFLKNLTYSTGTGSGMGSMLKMVVRQKVMKKM